MEKNSEVDKQGNAKVWGHSTSNRSDISIHLLMYSGKDHI